MKFRSTLVIALLSCCLGVASADDTLLPVKDALMRYDVETARKLIEGIEASSKKSKKNPLPEGLDEIKAQLATFTNALSRVEAIEIIDSVIVDKERFFSLFPINKSAGQLSDNIKLTVSGALPSNTVIYSSESDDELLWPIPGDNGFMTIVESSRLSDNSYTPPATIWDDEVNYDRNWPWLASDGVTLYFASNGDDSLGGYDIYITRKGDDGYLRPQNLGMPYNSPWDDYLLVIDEEAGLGWWASDRLQIPGKVVIYTFIPQELRKNYPADLPNIASLAMVKNIADSQQLGKDYSTIHKNAYIAKEKSGEPTFDNEYELGIYIPTKGIVKNIESLSSLQARAVAEDLAVLLTEAHDTQTRLKELRNLESLHPGKYSSYLIQTEQLLEEMPHRIQDLRNEIIRLELGELTM